MATASGKTSRRLAVAKTYKIFIGGQFPRTESARYYALEDRQGAVIANICRSSRKDFRNAMVAARDMKGDRGRLVKALPHAELREVLQRYGRLEPGDTD